MKSISFLLPCYNNNCSSLVTALHRQTHRLEREAGFRFEIIVYDDGSTSRPSLRANEAVCRRLTGCRLVRGKQNLGRSAARNRLAKEAECDYVLYIDSDLSVISPYFVENYLKAPDTDAIVGGLCIMGDPHAMRGSLRFRYEKRAAERSGAERRRESPYSSFHVSNLLIRRDIILSHPFDEHIRRYGYEDVLLGKQLEKDGIAVAHIDNPVGFMHFETNASFLAKTEEGLQTLHSMRDELRGYSGIQTVCERLAAVGMCWLLRLAFRLAAPALRRNLRGRKPSLLAYTLYRIGYYATLMKHNNAQTPPQS